MSKSLRTFFLSLLVVIFAVSSAFASFNITEDEKTDDNDCIEGYTYTARILVPYDATVTITNEDGEEVDIDGAVTAVSWNISPEEEWMKTYPISDDEGNWVLVIEAKLPAYDDTTSNDYSFDISATVSAVAENEFGVEDTYTETESYDLTFTVLQESYEKVVVAPEYSGDHTVYLSSDVDVEPDAVDEDYNVTLCIPSWTSSSGKKYLPAYIEIGNLGDDSSSSVRIFLPPWLSYDHAAIGTTSIDDVEYVTSINFFYNTSLDYEPEEGTEATVHIAGAPNLPDDDSSLPTYRLQTLEWNVTVGEASNAFRLVNKTANITLNFGETGTAELTYRGSAPVSWESDASAELGLAVTSSADNKITLTVNPTNFGTLSGNITFKGSEGEDSATLTVIVNPVINISEDKLDITTGVGQSNSGKINIVGANLASYDISPDIPALFGHEISNDSSTITLTISPTASGDYEGKLTVYDSAVHVASVDVILKATLDLKELSITPATTTVTVERGKSADVEFTAQNSLSNVTWTNGTLPTGITVVLSPSGTNNANLKITVTAGSNAVSGDVQINASEAGNDKLVSATLKVSVTIPTSGGDTPTPGGDTPDPEDDPYVPENIDSVPTISPSTLDEESQESVSVIKELTAGYTVEDAKISVKNLFVANREAWRLLIGDLVFKPTSYASHSVKYAANNDGWVASLTKASSSDVTVDITAPATVSENTAITLVAYDTGNNPHKLDLGTVAKTSGGGTFKGPGSNSGGCSAGFGALALVLAAPLFLRRKRS